MLERREDGGREGGARRRGRGPPRDPEAVTCENTELNPIEEEIHREQFDVVWL